MHIRLHLSILGGEILIQLFLNLSLSDLKAALQETQMLRVTSMSTGLLTVYIDSARSLPVKILI